MKTLGTLIIGALILVSVPAVGARSLSELESVTFSDQIQEDCRLEEIDVLEGCYWGEDHPRIILSSDLPEDQIIRVLAHELGHFFMEGTTEAEYNQVFFPLYPYFPFRVIREVAANQFSIWIQNPDNQFITPSAKAFFLESLRP